MQKISLFNLFIFQNKSILKSYDHTGQTHFWPCPPKKNYWSAFNFCESVSTCKTLVLPSVHSSDTVNFTVLIPDWLKKTQQKKFDKLLIFANLNQVAKNEAVSLTCSGEIADLTILQSDWLNVFWPLSKEQDFSQYRICDGTQQIIKMFHCRTNSVRIND